ncbi:MAG: hypothetical protein Q7S84_00145 [bacterium]|nr:hypothetical protein [bacterium]
MDIHHTIEPASICRDVLRRMKVTHALKRCPVCGNEMSSSACHAGCTPDVPTSVLDKSKVDMRNCETCGVLWTLWCRDTSNGGDQGNSSYWEGHQLYLTGFSNCFCRAAVLPQQLIHSAQDGYSRVRLGEDQECRAQES